MSPDRGFVGRMPRRGTDLVEDLVVWLLASVGLAVAVVALFAGIAGHEQVAERGQQERATRVQVDAVVLEDAPLLVDAAGVQPHAPVRWIGPQGEPLTAPVKVPAAAEAGDHVKVWVDRSGQPTVEPVSESGAILSGALSAIVVLLAGAVAIAGTWALVRRATTAHNHGRWEREWAQFGPDWTKRV